MRRKNLPKEHRYNMKKIIKALILIIPLFNWASARSQELYSMKAIDKDSVARLNKEYTSEGVPFKKKNPTLIISFSFDKADAIYKVGEPAKLNLIASYLKFNIHKQLVIY